MTVSEFIFTLNRQTTFFFYFRNQKKRTQTEFAQHEIVSYQVIVKRIQLMNDKIAYKHADKTDCTVHTQIQHCSNSSSRLIFEVTHISKMTCESKEVERRERKKRAADKLYGLLIHCSEQSTPYSVIIFIKLHTHNKWWLRKRTATNSQATYIVRLDFIVIIGLPLIFIALASKQNYFIRLIH